MSTEPVKILITGDFCPINRMEHLARESNFDPVFNDFAGEFRGNDLNVVDLECPLTLSESARLKTGPHQKAHPETVHLLKHLGIHVATLANNHIMDYGSEGFRDTMERCTEQGIRTVGAGSTAQEAEEPLSLRVRDRKVALVNMADNEFLTTPDGAFRCNPIDPVRSFRTVAQTRKDHDFVVVIVHGGNEFYELPSPRIKQLYRSLVEMGADAVVAHHTHAFSGYETYLSKPIFYGLGNFLYDWPGKRDQGWNRGYVVRLSLGDRVGFDVIPLKQNNEAPGIFHLDQGETDLFQKEINRLNGIIADDVQLEEKFLEYCRSVFPMYDAFLEPYFGKYITALRKRGLFPKLITRRKRLLYLNLVRCESHREVLLRLLKKYE
jgi:hypothetical protein